MTRAVVFWRAAEVVLGVGFCVFVAVVALLLVVVAVFREGVFRAVVVTFDFVGATFVGVDFFRVDDALVVRDVGVFRLVVSAFLAAILTLPAK